MQRSVLSLSQGAWLNRSGTRVTQVKPSTLVLRYQTLVPPSLRGTLPSSRNRSAIQRLCSPVNRLSPQDIAACISETKRAKHQTRQDTHAKRLIAERKSEARVKYVAEPDQLNPRHQFCSSQFALLCFQLLWDRRSVTTFVEL